MRVLLEPGSYACMNMGDVAMMQVCVSRLAELWPGATIQVVTQSPNRLAMFCPNAAPILESGKEYWFRDKIFGRFQKHRPSAMEATLRHRLPSAVSSLLALKRRIKGQRSAGITSFVQAVLRADLVIASGSGMINDEFRDRALQMLATFEMAHRLGKSTALFCQGIGPIADHGLLSCLKQVFPKITLISLREGSLGPGILKEVGYPSDRVLIAGDDALELAFANRTDVLGSAIGVNLRVAKYAQIEMSVGTMLHQALEVVAQQLKTSFIPVPILCRDDSDLTAIAPLISGYEDRSFSAPVESPLDVIRRVGRCRMVVTGSYHGAVFALGQGIPAVAVARSPYYLGKFQGLQNQFGDGCKLIDWSNQISADALIQAITCAWNSAPQHKNTLLELSQEQIRSADRAYTTLRSSVS